MPDQLLCSMALPFKLVLSMVHNFIVQLRVLKCRVVIGDYLEIDFLSYTSRVIESNFRFVFFLTCGCVVSERAAKNISNNVCPLCDKPYAPNEMIILNQISKEKIKLQRDAMEEKRQKRHDGKFVDRKLIIKLIQIELNIFWVFFLIK